MARAAQAVASGGGFHLIARQAADLGRRVSHVTDLQIVTRQCLHKWTLESIYGCKWTLYIYNILL